MAKKSAKANIVSMDYAEHDATYARFLALAKWGTGIMVILLILMAIFLV